MPKSDGRKRLIGIQVPAVDLGFIIRHGHELSAVFVNGKFKGPGQLGVPIETLFGPGIDLASAEPVQYESSAGPRIGHGSFGGIGHINQLGSWVLSRLTTLTLPSPPLPTNARLPSASKAIRVDA